MYGKILLTGFIRSRHQYRDWITQEWFLVCLFCCFLFSVCIIMGRTSRCRRDRWSIESFWACPVTPFPTMPMCGLCPIVFTFSLHIYIKLCAGLWWSWETLNWLHCMYSTVWARAGLEDGGRTVLVPSCVRYCFHSIYWLALCPVLLPIGHSPPTQHLLYIDLAPSPHFWILITTFLSMSTKGYCCFLLCGLSLSPGNLSIQQQLSNFSYQNLSCKSPVWFLIPTPFAQDQDWYSKTIKIKGQHELTYYSDVVDNMSRSPETS